MKYRTLGRTGLLVSEVCLGTMTWGGKGFWEVIGALGQDVVNTHLKQSVEAGVNFIDTANIYHEGLSEQMLGEAIRALGLPRHDLVIATKVRGKVGEGPNSTGLSRGHILHEVGESLRRLRTDYIDLYQIHGVDPLTPLEETLRALEDLVRAGKVRYLGVSNHAAWQIMKALGRAEREGWTRFEAIQAYYSLAGRDLEREILPLAKDQGLGVLAWSPLAGGLLSGKFAPGEKGPEGARRTSFDFPPVDRERAFACVEALRPIARAHDCGVARVALAWVLAQPAITSVIIGARSDEQLRDNLSAASVVLGPEELRSLDTVSRLPAEYPGWMLAWQARDRTGEVDPGQGGR